MKLQTALIIGYRDAFQVDVSRFSRSIEKIVRGLFFRKSGCPLPRGYRVAVFLGNEFWSDRGFQNLLAAMEGPAGCGDDVFQARCVRDSSDINITAWLLWFYGAMAFFAVTQKDVLKASIAPTHSIAEDLSLNSVPSHIDPASRSANQSPHA